MRTALCLPLLALALGAAPAPPPPLVLTLRPTATVRSPSVGVGDVATMEGGDAALRERIARLDLADLPLSGEPLFIPRSQVGFRLLLAGIDARSFRLEGAAGVRIGQAAEHSPEARVLAAAREALDRKLAGGSGDVRAELAHPVHVPTLPGRLADLRVEAEVRPLPPVPGRAFIDVSLFVQGQRRLVVPVHFDLRAAGSPAPPAPPATRPAAPLAAPSPPAPPLVRQHDVVHLRVNVGGLQVTARGEAMEDGRAGQVIRVRNTDSQAVITGRVVDRALVDVGF